MRKGYLFLIVIFAVILFSVNTGAQQFLNNSFENWGTDGNPVDWYTGNLVGIVEDVTQTSDAYDGNSAARLEISTFMGSKHYPTLQSLGEGLGHPMTEKYDNISGFYKFYPIEDAELLIVISVYDASQALLGVGGTSIFDGSDNWTSFNAPIEYFSESNPAYISASISVVDTSDLTDLTTVGSYAIIDYLTFGGATNVEFSSILPREFGLAQNYPNPFNPETTIQYVIPAASDVRTGADQNITSSNGLQSGRHLSLPQVHVKLSIYDILGHEIINLVNEVQKPGTYSVHFNGRNLPSGVYLYRLIYGEHMQTRRMMLIK